MKTILCATDYSENSIDALHYSDFLATTLGGSCTAMHVFDFLALSSTVSIAYSRKELAARAEESEKLKQFCEQHLGVTEAASWHYEIAEGRQPWEQICAKAKELNADYIVVGSRGSNPVRSFFLGSTTTALLDHSDSAVITVPQGPLRDNVKYIIYASALEEADILAIKNLVPSARQWKAEIVVLHIVTPTEYSGEYQMEWFKDMVHEKVGYKKLRFKLLHSDNRLASLQRYVEHSGADLLVMMEREERTFLEALWHPDLVKQMHNEIKIPLLSFSKKHLREAPQ